MVVALVFVGFMVVALVFVGFMVVAVVFVVVALVFLFFFQFFAAVLVQCTPRKHHFLQLNSPVVDSSFAKSPPPLFLAKLSEKLNVPTAVTSVYNKHTTTIWCKIVSKINHRISHRKRLNREPTPLSCASFKALELDSVRFPYTAPPQVSKSTVSHYHEFGRAPCWPIVLKVYPRASDQLGRTLRSSGWFATEADSHFFWSRTVHW